MEGPTDRPARAVAAAQGWAIKRTKPKEHGPSREPAGSDVVPGLDRRFGWSEPPLAAVVAAQALALASCLGMLKVFLVNRWAGRTVETWPGQEVITGYEEYRKNPASLWVPLGGLAEPVSACQTSSMTKHGTPREIKENEYVGGEEEE